MAQLRLITADSDLLGLIQKSLFFAKALPEPDLKYRSSLRAVISSVTATYDLKTTGRYPLVDATCPL